MPLAKSQGKLDQFFLLSQDLFLIIDLSGIFLNVNPMFETLLGYSSSAWIGKPCGKVVERRDISMYFQGFYFARPIAFSAIRGLLHESPYPFSDAEPLPT